MKAPSLNFLYFNKINNPQKTELTEVKVASEVDQKVVEKSRSENSPQSNIFLNLLCTAVFGSALYYINSTQGESNRFFEKSDFLSLSLFFAMGVLCKKLNDRVRGLESKLEQFHRNSTSVRWEEIENKPRNLKEYYLYEEVLHASITDDFFHTDDEWYRGVHRTKAAYFLPRNDALVEAYQPGRFVEFINGEKRKITSVEIVHSKAMVINVDGDLFNPDKVGVPSRYLLLPSNDQFHKHIDVVA